MGEINIPSIKNTKEFINQIVSITATDILLENQKNLIVAIQTSIIHGESKPLEMELTRKLFSNKEMDDNMIGEVKEQINRNTTGKNKEVFDNLAMANKVIQKTAQFIKDAFEKQGEYVVKLGEKQGRPISIKEKGEDIT